MAHWKIMQERFGNDSLIALATTDEQGLPWVRTVNAWFDEGCFYVITYALSGKMKQISKRSQVALCGDWFTGHGEAKNLGYILLNENLPLTQKLRTVFSSWYRNGHVNEEDPNTVILQIKVTDGVLFHHGTRIEFKA